MESLREYTKSKSGLAFEEARVLVLDWAHEKGIFDKGTPVAQAGKTLEEATEIIVAIAKNDIPEIIDGIGDTLVTLIIQCEMQKVHPLDCLESAYNVIAKRTGKMVNGEFVKD